MNTFKKILVGFLVSLLALVSMAVIAVSLTTPEKVQALSDLVINSTNTSNPFSTSTLNFMAAGTGTTTYAFNTLGYDQVAFNMIFAASSTSSQLRWRYEYSADALNWYADDIELTTQATTTVHVRDFAEHSWTYASSTAGSSVSGAAFKHVKVQNIISPYMRVVLYMPVGSTPGGVFVQSVKKSNNAR